MNLDFDLIAYNVRCMRMARNMTQAEMAQKAGIDHATLHRLETGHRVRLTTLEKVAIVLKESVEFMNAVLPYGMPGQRHQLFIHRNAELNWFTVGDKRKRVPNDNQARIQDREERLRLGRSKVVEFFQAYLFAMPAGPAISFSEIYERVKLGPNPSYEDCICHCVSGQVVVTVLGQEIHLGQGDAVGFSGAEPSFVEPAHPIGPQDHPPVIMNITANRIGNVPVEFWRGKRARVRHPRTRLKS